MSSLNFTYSPYWLLILIPFAVGISVLYYYKTKPEIEKFKKIILGTLRSILIILLFILLLKPFLNYVFTEEEKPVIVVLQDNSKSLILIPDSSKIKNQYPQEFRKFIENIKSSNKAEIETYLFAEETQNKDTVNFSGNKTNIANALNEVLEENEDLPLHSIYLISDGIYNEGTNPIYTAEKIKIPINTILLGDTNQYPDVFIENVIYNKTAFLETEIPIKVIVNKNQTNIKNTTVFLKDARGKILKKQNISFKNDIPTEIEWFIPITKEGFYHFVVEVPTLQQEINKANNLRHIYIKVIKDKINITLIAGEPHPDLASFSRALQFDKRFSLKKFIKFAKNSFKEKPTDKDLLQTNVFILYNFPNGLEDKNLTEKILQRVRKGEAGLFFVVGNRTDFRDFPELTSILPMKPKRFTSQFSEAMLYPDEMIEQTPVWTFDNEFKNWLETAPPVFVNNSEWVLQNNALPVVRVKIKSIKTEYIAFAMAEANNSKSFISVAQNLWKLRNANYLFSQDFAYYDDFLKNTLQWLSVNVSKKRFFVEANKNFYLEYEPIYIQANLRDEALKPISDAMINVEIRKKNSRDIYSYVLEPTGNGLYSYKIPSLPEGEYELLGTAKKDNKTLAQAKDNFVVAHSTIEALNLQANKPILQQIALRTNGKFFTSLQDAQKHFEQQEYPTVLNYVEKNINLNEWLPLLIIILLVASSEWFLRRYWGLL